MPFDIPAIPEAPKKQPRATNKLNVLLIKAAQQTCIETGKSVLLSDGGGLYLRIEADGKARWTYRYTRPDGSRGERGLGSYGQVTLKMARELVQAERDRLKMGLDPVQARQDDRRAARALRATPTFGDAADSYIDKKVAVRASNAKHLYQWRQTLGDSYCAAIRKKRIDLVTTDDVLAVLLQPTKKKRLGQEPVTGPLWDVKPETASRLLDRIKRVLDWATVEHWRKGDNPARYSGLLEHKLSPKSAQVRHHPSMHYSEVPDFVAALRTRQAASARALEFLILTACRAGEVRGAVWEEFDLVGKVWTIPASRMKARVEHRVPLTDRMIEIISAQQPDDKKRSGLIFRNRADGIMSDMVFNALMDRMGRTGITAHGFRSSFRNWAGDDENGAPDDIAEAALAHAYGSAVQRAYRQSPAFQLREKLMIAWGQHCAGETATSDNVVALRKQRTRSGANRRDTSAI